MTGSTQEYIDYVLELLEPINAISAGRFFGGQGVTCNNAQFAMMMGNRLFFVVDDSTRDTNRTLVKNTLYSRPSAAGMLLPSLQGGIFGVS